MIVAPNVRNNTLALKAGSAIASDTLSRATFAQTAANIALESCAEGGAVISIEGRWGSGKTSLLAMIEETILAYNLSQEPVIIHFSPWLIGDKDSLLKVLLSNLADAVGATSKTVAAKQVSEQLINYSKAFDVLKLLPGAEPWATIVKKVLFSVGDATGAAAKQKVPNIEKTKTTLTKALLRFKRPIIVMIDDIDRLYPAEVYELIRIIKAAGDLPCISYIVAMDPEYVSAALNNLLVPKSERYLEKIIQTRMPLPTFSEQAKRRLVANEIDLLGPAASENYFPDDPDRISHLYYSGLRELIESPRDVFKIFNTTRRIESALRGEIRLSDIIGLCAIMEKAPDVYRLLCARPEYFTGRSPAEYLLTPTAKIVEIGAKERTSAYESSSDPRSALRVSNFLFPLTSSKEDRNSGNRTLQGSIADPARLSIALQLCIIDDGVSLRLVRDFLNSPKDVAAVSSEITAANLVDFFESAGDLAYSIEDKSAANIERVCLKLSRLLDREPLLDFQRDTFISPPDAACGAIEKILGPRWMDGTQKSDTISSIVGDPMSLTIAAIVISAAMSDSSPPLGVGLNSDELDLAGKRFAGNVVSACSEDRMFLTSMPSRVLWALAQVSPVSCKIIFEHIRGSKKLLDAFITHIAMHSFDSNKGQSYGLFGHESIVSNYCDLSEIRNMGSERLDDPTLIYPERAAWTSVVEGKNLYGCDGSERVRM